MKIGRLLLPGLATVATGFVLFLALSYPVSDTVVSRAPSPDGKFLAVHFARSVSTSADVSHHVVLQPAEAKFRVRDAETVFVADHPGAVRLRWDGPRTLRVDFDGGNVFREEKETQGIHIVFTAGRAPQEKPE